MPASRARWWRCQRWCQSPVLGVWMMLAIEPNVKTMEPPVSLLDCLCAMMFLTGFGCVDFFYFLLPRSSWGSCELLHIFLIIFYWAYISSESVSVACPIVSWLMTTASFLSLNTSCSLLPWACVGFPLATYIESSAVLSCLVLGSCLILSKSQFL